MGEAPNRARRDDVLLLREKLSPRDRLILEDVAALRLMHARQIQELLFPAEQHASAATAARCCRRVLERLTRDRLLVRLDRRVGGVRAGSASFIYALGTLGQRVIEEPGARRRHAEPSVQFVDHTLAVSEFFVRVAAHIRAESWELLGWESEPASWRDVLTLGGRVVLRPDLFLTLAVGEYELRWFVEIDRGTEHLPAIHRKCRLYNSYYKSGNEQRRHAVFPRVLWLTTSERRSERIRRQVDADRLLTTELFTVTSSTDEALAALGGAR